MAEKRVYFFGSGKAEGNATMKELLGGKGANLAEMTSMKIPVPPGFTIATKVCDEYYKNKAKWPKGLAEEIDRNMAKLEKAMNAKLGDIDKPLLVSVRSGAAVSMPGMMDTVLNLGLNDDVIEGIIKRTGNPRFAYDIYRRFIDMFGDVVMGCHHEYFEHILHTAKKKAKVELDNELSAEQLKDVVEKYKAVYKKHVGRMFPQDGRKQLTLAINAVIKSWMIERAIKYRQLNKNWIKKMLFGLEKKTTSFNIFFQHSFEKLQKRECEAKGFFTLLLLFVPRQATLAPNTKIQEPMCQEPKA